MKTLPVVVAPYRGQRDLRWVTLDTLATSTEEAHKAVTTAGFTPWHNVCFALVGTQEVYFVRADAPAPWYAREAC